MSHNYSSLHSLGRVFREGFVVHDIAEPLISFDASTSAGEVKAFMDSRRFEVVGIRVDGAVAGFVESTDLGDGACGDYIKRFDESRVVLDTTPLADLVLQLREHRRLFVSILGHVGAIVSRSDLQKPPVRMWLFGMVSLIEMRFGWMIERWCPDDQWMQHLSDGRVEKARQLLAERSRRNQELALVDCLQLSDKAQIVARNPQLRELTQFGSRRQLEAAAKMLERLRNHLAHSQDIVTEDWETIVTLSEQLDRVLEGPPGLKDEGG